MGSLYLNRLSRQEYERLKRALWEAQRGVCFICEQPIDWDLHVDSTDVDHIVPSVAGGKDDPSNFALTHLTCNRSKQAADLRVARLLARFQRLQDECGPLPGRPNLSDVLGRHGGARYQLPLHVRDGCVSYSCPDIGRTEVVTVPLHTDPLSQMSYFFAVIPIAYLAHDDRINPRAIAASSLRRLIEEFHAGLPQLQPALAWATMENGQPRAAIKVFDGQHKAAAQVLLGVSEIPLRVFVNPDFDRLLTANTHAGTTLRQVAFDMSVQRHLGSQLLADRIDRYLADLGRPADDRSFSEKDLVNHFKGQWREVRRYILDDVRDWVTHHPENRLRGYIDFGGRSTERPISYSTIERTFYSLFIYQDVLTTPMNYLLEQGENPRELEKEQILRLMNIVADRIYVGQYDPAIGTAHIETRLQDGEEIPPGHVRAFRMAKEEVMYTWLKLVGLVVKNYFVMQGVPFDEARIFQYRFPQPLWDRIDRLVENLAGLPLWISRQLSATVFGGRQSHEFWHCIFETGHTPTGQQVLAEPINIMKLIA